jgi:hypothetical protein
MLREAGRITMPNQTYALLFASAFTILSSGFALAAPSCAPYQSWRLLGGNSNSVRFDGSKDPAYFELTLGSGVIELQQDLTVRPGLNTIRLHLKVDGNNSGFTVGLYTNGVANPVSGRKLNNRADKDIVFRHTVSPSEATSGMAVTVRTVARGKTYGWLGPVRVCQ